VIYFYYGENDFALKRAAEQLATDFVAKFGIDAVTKIDASETDSAKILSEIFNVSLFAPRRLIVVSNATENKDFWRMLDDNLVRISDSANDVLLIAKTPDKRTKTYKDLLKDTGKNAREFLPLKHYEMTKWIANEATKLAMKISLDAAEGLATACGDDQWRIFNELQKLAALGQTIDKKLVQEFVEPDLTTNAFEIFALSLSSEQIRAQNELQKLRDSGEDANRFFGLLTSQVFALVGAVFGSGSDVAKDLKIHPFQLGKMRDLAQSLGNAAEQKVYVKKVVRLLAEADARMKLSRSDEAWTIAEVMLAQTMPK